MYTIIFGRCIHVLLRRRKHSRAVLYPVCTTLLFAFATLFVGTMTFGTVKQAVVLFRAAKTRDFEPLVEYLAEDTGKTVWA